MKARLVLFYLLLLLGSILLIKFQYTKIEILSIGKEIIIEKGYFSTPSNCEFLSKNNSFFLKFEFKNKSHSLRIKSKDCLKIKGFQKLKLLTNKEENVFVFNSTTEKIELMSSIILFLILSIFLYKLLVKTKT